MGYVKSCWLASMLWVGVLGGAGASDAPPSEATCPGKDAYSPFDVLDTTTPDDKRRAAVDTVVRLAADPACRYERSLLGALYRFGPQLEGNPLPKDSVRAVDLIEEAALRGRPALYADLAELSLADGDARGAMQWTQVYLWVQAQQGPGKQADFDRSGYNADLLLRAQRAWQKARLGGNASIDALLKTYLEPRRAQLKEAIANGPDAVPRDDTAGGSHETLRIKRGPRGRKDVNIPIKAGYAIFLMEVRPDGTVGRIVAETFAPTPAHAKALRPFVDGFEYYPFEGTTPELVRVPVQYGYTGAFAPKLRR